MLIDGLLEWSIVGSFSRIGSAVRRRLFDWSDPSAGVLLGRTVLVTGPTSGLGRDDRPTALPGSVRASSSSGVTPPGSRPSAPRSPPRTAADRAVAVVADMSSHPLRRRGRGARSAPEEGRLDVVIDNAGAMFPERTVAPDGIEATLATMVVGPFALIAGLLPLLRGTGQARVVAVTSGGMYAQPLDLDDLAWARRPWSGTRAYAQAKRAQVALIREWARRVPPDEVAFSAMHPGWAATPGLAASLPGFSRLMGPLLRTPDEGADTAIWLAADPVGSRGDRAPVPRPARPPVRPRPTDPPDRGGPPAPLGPRRPHGGRRRSRDRAGAPRTSKPHDHDKHWSLEMTRLHERIETDLPIDEAFDYIADFAHADEWDPNTTAAKRLGNVRPGLGARFALEVRMGGRTAPMEYRITEYERPRRVVLVRRGVRRDDGRRHPLRARR